MGMRPPPKRGGKWWPIIWAVSQHREDEYVAVKVSREDYAWLSRYKWRLEKKTGYVYRRSNSRWIAMHREILGLPPYKKDKHRVQDLDGRIRWRRRTVDHRNRDILDNRRLNLEPVLHIENMHRWMREDGRMEPPPEVDD